MTTIDWMPVNATVNPDYREPTPPFALVEPVICEYTVIGYWPNDDGVVVVKVLRGFHDTFDESDIPEGELWVGDVYAANDEGAWVAGVEQAKTAARGDYIWN